MSGVVRRACLGGTFSAVELIRATPVGDDYSMECSLLHIMLKNYTSLINLHCSLQPFVFAVPFKNIGHTQNCKINN